MKRVNCILEDDDFLSYIAKNKELEQDRMFCHHDINHLLDVCRIAWILNLEENLSIPKETVYASGLLHDIGRWVEYETGKDHAIASGELADSILTRCGFLNDEKANILRAIISHRNKEHRADLSRILYRADKLSRPCFHCDAKSRCKRFQKGEKQILYFRY
ncbi:HD domain-containing protein [Proteiniborus sp. MB09-C3]|uniref:HD domain-containing protein n=1 Tax=Proteiniborus sp. MB09-C3 TaxID=3050072 RepID=UPI002557553D|nr:HD domain-containing protein [Proteiniborus sp. MB09-C3]WIV13361.1 HD domain-containing protein [Proteiniborus sp. MB09-C3]